MDHYDRNPIEWQNLRDNREISVLLVRHGQTEWNRTRRFLGRTDIPLNATGKQQAGQLSASISHLPLVAIYSSPLSRAWQTAEAIACNRRLTVLASEGLTELDQGDLEGRFGDALKEDFPEFFDQWMTDPTDVRIPGGETLAECTHRAVEAFFDIVKRHEPGQIIAIVSHKVAISGILCHALDRPIRDNMKIEQQNTAVNFLGIRDGTITAHVINQADHLLPTERP